MSNETIFKPGFQVYALPRNKGVWQFTLFAIGHENWAEDEYDHDSYEQSTWYVQFLFWQFSFTKEIDYDRRGH